MMRIRINRQVVQAMEREMQWGKMEVIDFWQGEDGKIYVQCPSGRERCLGKLQEKQVTVTVLA